MTPETADQRRYQNKKCIPEPRIAAVGVFEREAGQPPYIPHRQAPVSLHPVRRYSGHRASTRMLSFGNTHTQAGIHELHERTDLFVKIALR